MEIPSAAGLNVHGESNQNSLRTEEIRTQLESYEVHAVFPGDPTFPEVSAAYNRRFTVKPAAILFPADGVQVAHVVKIAAEHKYRVVARSGGHGYTANGLGGSDGAVVVDLRKMAEIQLSPLGTADVQTGNTIGQVALALNKKGRAIPHGSCPFVGIGGHAGYGGFGFTSRMWGLALDTILSMTVVMADGTITTIPEGNKPDLFWAMRGAIDSFGIATSFTVRTFEAPASATIFNYVWDFTPSEAARAVSIFQDFAQTDIPKEFGPQFAIRKGRAHGLVSLTLLGGWYGPTEKLESVLAPYLASLPEPNDIKLVAGSYMDSVKYLGDRDSAPAHAFYAKSMVIPETHPISDCALNALMTCTMNEGFQHDLDWRVLLGLYGGRNSAINAVAHDATAFSRRNTLWTIQFIWPSPDSKPPFPDSGLTFLDNMVDSLIKNSPQDWEYGGYLNYVDDRVKDWKKLYYGHKYDKLQRIKQEYDPDNIFSIPMGINQE